MQKITTKSGAVVFWPSMEDLMQADEDQTGFCTACGEEQACVEPDAQRYVCECCGEAKVYGTIEFVLRGWTS